MQKTGRVGLVFTYLRGQEQLVMEGIFFIVFKDKISRKCQNELHFFITYLGKEMVCWNWEIDMGKKCFLLSSKRVYVQEEIFLISIRNEWKEMNFAHTFLQQGSQDLRNNVTKVVVNHLDS